MIAGIDGRSLARGQAGRGVSHYTSSLVGALARAFPDDRWRLLVPGGLAAAAPDGVEVVAPRPVGPAGSGVELVCPRLPRQILFGAGALIGRPRLDRLAGPVEVSWLPAPAPVALSRGARYVLTVHDLSFLERPGDYTPYERAWHRLGRLGSLARRATRVIAVSAATRDAAIAAWGLDAARVAVVPSGVSGPAIPPSAAAVQAVRRRHGLPERYLLWVGALEPRKAPDALARAYAGAREDGLDAGLAVVGDGRVALAGEGVRRLGTIRDRSELEALYAGALALVMPSRAEGYGFGPLEAAACGTASVVTDIPALRETLGDAALFVAVDDDLALARALLQVAGDPALRDRMATAAAQRVAGRTWAATAQATHAILEEAADARI